MERPTRHPPPERDPAVEELPDGDRALVAAVWEARATAEAEAAASFALVARRAAEARLPAELPLRLARAADDEHRHVEICRRVAAAYRGAEAAAPAPAALDEPSYPGAPDGLRATLHVVSLCAINETIGGAALSFAHEVATARPARAALRELLADEVEHGRIGWTLLAAADASTRAALTPWLVPLLDANLRTWRRATGRHAAARPTVGWPAHGCPSAAAIDAAVCEALRDLVLPGLGYVGLDTSAARAWLAAPPPR